MRILHIIPGLTQERGGPSAVIQALVDHQTRAGHEVVVLTTDQGLRNGETPVALHPDTVVDYVRVRGPDRVAYAPTFRSVVRRRLRETQVAHVHSVFTYPIHVALQEALASGVPVVLRPCGHLHRYSLLRSRRRKSLYLKIWGGLIRTACSAWHYTSTQEAKGSWPWDDSPRFVLANGIDADAFAMDRSQAREIVAQSWPQLGQSPYVLFLGRLHPKKRLDLLLEAFLGTAPESFKLVIAGPDESSLWHPLAARWLSDSGASSRIVRLGTVAGREKVALLAGASLFALPSEHENFGLAALESVAAGTPVLLSPHVDVEEAVREAGLGYSAPLVVAEWCAALDRLLADPERIRQTERARAWARKHYGWERIAATLIRHYEDVLAAKVPPVPAASLSTG